MGEEEVVGSTGGRLKYHKLKFYSFQPEEDTTMERDRKGFLNCNNSPRRFLTKVGFQNHLSIQHGLNKKRN